MLFNPQSPVPHNGTILSYAKNNEDVLLQRAFVGIDHGYYVDVGAFMPKNDSCTFALYQRGWRGLVIEPLTYIFDSIKQAWQIRPRDQLIAGIAAGENGEHDFWLCNARQMSTGSRRIIEQCDTGGNVIGAPSQIPAFSLDYLLQTYAPAQVHLLKIDVEGMEGEVLAGIDLQRHRPWLIVIECMRPGTQDLSDDEWSLKLISADYQWVYEDGSNRWYLAQEHIDLAPKLKYPANAWDHWMPARQAELEAELEASLRGMVG